MSSLRTLALAFFAAGSMASGGETAPEYIIENGGDRGEPASYDRAKRTPAGYSAGDTCVHFIRPTFGKPQRAVSNVSSLCVFVTRKPPAPPSKLGMGGMTYGTYGATTGTCLPVEVQKTAPDSNVREGERVTYVIKVTNKWIDPVKDLVLIDCLPKSLEYVSLTGPGVQLDGVRVVDSPEGDKIVIAPIRGELGANTSRTFRLYVRVKRGGGAK